MDQVIGFVNEYFESFTQLIRSTTFVYSGMKQVTIQEWVI